MLRTNLVQPILALASLPLPLARGPTNCSHTMVAPPPATLETVQLRHEQLRYGARFPLHEQGFAHLYFEAFGTENEAQHQLKMEWNANLANVAPVVCYQLPGLLEEFLAAKREHGSTVEKSLYAKMSALRSPPKQSKLA